jgi:hypothetical protein
VPATPAGTGSSVLEDGRHPVYLTGLDVTGHSVEFDLIRFLQNGEADAYAKAHPEETGWSPEYGYPEDYLVVNENPRLRSLPVADDARVTVLQTADLQYNAHQIAFADLPGYIAMVNKSVPPPEHKLTFSVYWLTVQHGKVVDIEEQFQS